MKVALALWHGRISPVFDVTRQVLLFDIENGRVHAKREEILPGTGFQEQAERMAETGAEVLICGAISQPMMALVMSKGIRLFPFIAGSAEDVLAEWLMGRLRQSALRMPGCCGMRRRWRFGLAAEWRRPQQGWW